MLCIHVVTEILHRKYSKENVERRRPVKMGRVSTVAVYISRTYSTCSIALSVVSILMTFLPGINGYGTTTISPSSGSIRLVGSDVAYPYHGIVEVFIDGEWGAICDDNIYPESKGDDFAEVVCRQLGHHTTDGSASEAPRGGLAYDYTTMFYDGLRCTGSEDRLEDCSYYTKRDTSCQSGKYAASVRCYNSTDYDSGDGLPFNFFSWIGIVIFISIVSMFVVRRYRQRRLLQQQQQQANTQVVYNANNGTVIPPPTATSYPPPPPGSYPSQPQAYQYPPPGTDLPPQYSSVQATPYPTKNDGTQYPTPAGAQYPPPAGAHPPPAGSGTQYPPPAGSQYPPGAYPPPQAGVQYPPPSGAPYPPPGGAPHPPPGGADSNGPAQPPNSQTPAYHTQPSSNPAYPPPESYHPSNYAPDASAPPPPSYDSVT